MQHLTQKNEMIVERPALEVRGGEVGQPMESSRGQNIAATAQDQPQQGAQVIQVL